MTVVKHQIQRVFHELRPRLLEVARVVPLSPAMVRVTLTGPEIEGFSYAAPADHVKVCLPAPGATEPVLPEIGPHGLRPRAAGPANGPTPILRDYTVRYHRPDASRPEHGEIDIDFVLHGGGPATDWAAQAAAGQRLGVLGPRGSLVNPYDFDWYLLAGDETALPAIGAWLEQVPAEAAVTAFVEVADAAVEQPMAREVRWLHRDAGESLEAAVKDFDLPGGEGYAFVAGEAGALKPIRRWLRGSGLPKEWMTVDGYWKHGVANHNHHAVDEDD